MAILNKASRLVITSLERFFEWWGKYVSKHPHLVILICAFLTALSGLGFLNFRMEHKANMLWIPETSEYNINQDWLDHHFKKIERNQVILYKSKNVLTPESLREMMRVYKRVMQIEVDGKTFQDMCARVPIANIFQTKRRRKRQAIISQLEQSTHEEEFKDYWDYYEYEDEDYEEEIEPIRVNYHKYGHKSDDSNYDDSTDGLPDNIYCDLVTTLSEKCILTSLLEIWRYDETLIETASQQEILDAVNLLYRSPWYGYDTRFEKILGGVERNESGHIVAASIAQMFWRTKVPEDAVIVNSQGSGLELELADQATLDWEEQFLEIGFNESTKEHKFIPQAAKSFGDVSSDAIFFDAFLMAGGFILMFMYTFIMLGKMNCVEVRLYLSIAGLISIGMGLVVAWGLSSALGFPYTPLHAALPFLCLGIGIDDMFVIMQCWNNLKRDPATFGLSIPDKMGLTLKHAGVSVTVTSVTDVFAFGVGAVSRMPGLQSFCVCTAIGLGAIFVLQVSWFAAWLSIDEKRVEKRKNAFLPCVGHEDKEKNISPGLERDSIIIKGYANLLKSNVFKFFVVLTSATFLGFGVFGWIQMRQKFDPILLLPSDSYLREWIREFKEYYPGNGWEAQLYSGPFTYKDLEGINDLEGELKNLIQTEKLLRDEDFWWSDLKRFTRDKTNYTSWKQFSNEKDFPIVLSDFLFSSYGAQFKPNFQFASPLVCNEAAPSIIASKFDIGYFDMPGPEQHIPAKRAVTNAIVKSQSPYTFSHTKIYAAWETDEIIGAELWRNIGLAMACVFTVTLLLLTNLRICLLVMLTVVFTLCDIVGFLHFWDITIDITSCVNIVLAIGLCVDYSVHIAHAYLIAKGNRQEKSVEAITTIGPAVLNGGITTFLALVLCSMSTSHVFITFFKVFSLTVMFGLFHGLVLFPVILSLIGPLDTSISERSDSRLTGSSSSGSTNNISLAESPDVLSKQGGLDNPVFTKEGKTGILDQQWIQPEKEDTSQTV